MNIPKINKSFIARHRLRFGLGTGIVGTFLFVFNLLTFAKVWESTFEFYHIPPVVIYIGMPICYLIICWYIGFLYDTKGFWEEETSHSNKHLNPEFDKLCIDINNISAKLNEVNDKADKIDKKLECEHATEQRE